MGVWDQGCGEEEEEVVVVVMALLVGAVEEARELRFEGEGLVGERRSGGGKAEGWERVETIVVVCGDGGWMDGWMVVVF